MSAIMKDEPPPISKVQPVSPPQLDRIVKTCLAKDPDERWQNAHDLAKELNWIEEGTPSGRGISEVHAKQRALPWILLVFVILIAAVSWLPNFKSTNTSNKIMRFTILPPSDNELTDAPIISPDGTRIVFSAAD